MRDTLSKLKYIMSDKERQGIAGLIVMMFIGGVLELIGVAGVFPVISNIVKESDKSNSYMITLCVILIGIYVVKNLYLAFMYRTIFAYVYKGRSALGTRLFNIYMREPYSFHLNRNVATIQRAVRSDVDGCYAVIKNLLQIAAEGIICLVLCGLLFYTDWKMSLFLMALLLVCCGVTIVASKKTVKKLGQEEMKYSDAMNRWIITGAGGIKEITVLERQQYFTDGFEDNSKASARCNRRQQLLALLPRMVTETVCIAGIMIWIIILVVSGKNLENAIPTLAVFAVSAFRLLPSVGKINSLMTEYHFYKPRVDFIYEDLKDIENASYKADEKTENVHFESGIELKNVSFKYDGTDKLILDNVSLTISKGESIGIAGPSGEGKTTLIDVILGLLNDYSGDILIDKKNIKENIKGWHNILGYVPQEIYLSDDTIRNNIAFGINANDIDDERINEAIKNAQLDKFISELPDGLDTIVGERGVKLSGGQRQRIGIARALYNSPKVLVMDEATSALDNETESAVMEAIEALHGKITMIIIAHRLSTIEKCDRVYRIEDGKVNL